MNKVSKSTMFIARINVYIERSKKYLGTIQLFLLLAIFIQNNLNIYLAWWHYGLLFLFSPIIFIIVGYIDVKLKIMSGEQKFQGDENPIFDKFFENQNEIIKLLKRGKK